MQKVLIALWKVFGTVKKVWLKSKIWNNKEYFLYQMLMKTICLFNKIRSTRKNKLWCKHYIKLIKVLKNKNLIS